MNETQEEIAEKLSRHRALLKSTFGLPERRIALLQLLRTVDYQLLIDWVENSSESPEDQLAHSSLIRQLFRWGLNEALDLLWTDEVKRFGVPLTKTSPTLRSWGNMMLQCSGRVRLIEHGIEMTKFKLGTLTKESESSNRYIFEYAEDATGVEAIEVADSSIFRELIHDLNKKDGIWKDLSTRRHAIHERMTPMVSTWHDHYIRYNTDPTIDELYTDSSFAIAPLKFGWDAFPLDSTFGGIKFFVYINCVRMLISFALKHLDFSIILGKKEKNIDAINILTVHSSWKDSVFYMSIALGISEKEAKQVMETTVLNDDNLKHHASMSAAAYAPHYQISDGSIVRLLTGCLDEPFLFMLRELKRRYPGDWDRSVDSREGVFREQLAALLTNNYGIAVLSDSLNITCSQGKTDIDMIALDALRGVVGIFQLKWQDYFGASIRERESKKSNFHKTGNFWVERISRWLSEDLLLQNLLSLGVPKAIAKNIKEVRIFVIGRNFSHFSGSSNPDPRAAWGSWSQVMRIMTTPRSGISALAILHESLVSDSPSKRTKPPEEVQEIEVDDWKFIIKPNSTWSKSE